MYNNLYSQLLLLPIDLYALLTQNRKLLFAPFKMTMDGLARHRKVAHEF